VNSKKSGTSCAKRPVFRNGDALVNRFQFVADHQRRHGVKRLCTILGIARSSFYYWRKTAGNRAARQAADAKLAAKIRAAHRESDGTYGVPRISAELREDGERVNHKRIARVMRGIGLAGVRLRRRHRTTVPDLAAEKAPDLIGRAFTASAVNTKYVGDITYLMATSANRRSTKCGHVRPGLAGVHQRRRQQQHRLRRVQRLYLRPSRPRTAQTPAAADRGTSRVPRAPCRRRRARRTT
jgi:transposase InsO family protein